MLKSTLQPHNNFKFKSEMYQAYQSDYEQLAKDQGKKVPTGEKPYSDLFPEANETARQRISEYNTVSNSGFDRDNLGKMIAEPNSQDSRELGLKTNGARYLAEQIKESENYVEKLKRDTPEDQRAGEVEIRIAREEEKIESQTAALKIVATRPQQYRLNQINSQAKEKHIQEGARLDKEAQRIQSLLERSQDESEPKDQQERDLSRAIKMNSELIEDRQNLIDSQSSASHFNQFRSRDIKEIQENTHAYDSQIGEFEPLIKDPRAASLEINKDKRDGAVSFSKTNQRFDNAINNRSGFNGKKGYDSADWNEDSTNNIGGIEAAKATFAIKGLEKRNANFTPRREAPVIESSIPEPEKQTELPVAEIETPKTQTLKDRLAELAKPFTKEGRAQKAEKRLDEKRGIESQQIIDGFKAEGLEYLAFDPVEATGEAMWDKRYKTANVILPNGQRAAFRVTNTQDGVKLFTDKMTKLGIKQTSMYVQEFPS
jgi:hypothetical protein